MEGLVSGVETSRGGRARGHSTGPTGEIDISAVAPHTRGLLGKSEDLLKLSLREGG